MGFIIDSELEPLLSVELRRESFCIHRGGLDYGNHGEQHIELPIEDAEAVELLVRRVRRSHHLGLPLDWSTQLDQLVAMVGEVRAVQQRVCRIHDEESLDWSATQSYVAFERATARLREILRLAFGDSNADS